MIASPGPDSSAEALRAAFDAARPFTVGIEDELLLLDPHTLELAPLAGEILELTGDDRRFKPELPASQLEIVTPACETVAEAAAILLDARRDLMGLAAGVARAAGAGAHPFSAGLGELNRLPRYERVISEYAPVLRRELVCALQVHVGVGDADRAMAVHNAARSYLPLLAALAANAPFYEGRDSGLASVRPKLAELLPRHGIPPQLTDWAEYAQILDWGARTGAFPDVQSWWWELRLHPSFGTLEFRVPDAQSTVAEAAAISAVVQALVAHLCDRLENGEALPVAPAWQIAQNSWSACRHGLDGSMADLVTGETQATRAAIEQLLELLEPVAARLGSSASLRRAAELGRRNGAQLQREIAADGGVAAVVRWLSERFLEPWEG